MKPQQHAIPKKSLTSEEDAKRLWEESEKLLGITSQICEHFPDCKPYIRGEVE